jgi:hypothetical protein
VDNGAIHPAPGFGHARSVDREKSQHASLVMTRMIASLADCPAVVFSRFGEVLLRTGPAVALFGDRPGRLVEVGVTGIPHLRRYRHVELGELQLYRQVLVDPVELQVLLVLTAVPGSPSDERIRRL